MFYSKREFHNLRCSQLVLANICDLFCMRHRGKQNNWPSPVSGTTGSACNINFRLILRPPCNRCELFSEISQAKQTSNLTDSSLFHIFKFQGFPWSERKWKVLFTKTQVALRDVGCSLMLKLTGNMLPKNFDAR